MIKISLTLYKGSFRTQLDFISEYAWLYNIKDLYIEDNFFNDYVDMYYYPIFLKNKENIILHYIEGTSEKIDYKNNNYSINDLVKYYNSNNNYYIDLYQLINELNREQQYLLQLINRYNFKKLEILLEELKETIYVYQSKKYYYYFIINDTDKLLTHKNTYEKIILSSKIKICDNDKFIMEPSGFVIYYN